MSDSLLAIEIGATKLQLAVGDSAGRIHARVKMQVRRDQGAAGIRAQIAEGVKTLAREHRWRSVGVGFGGPSNWTTGNVACSLQVGGWNDFALGDWLRELCAAPVHIDNDSNVAALAEAVVGAAAAKAAMPAADPVFYTNSGSGVGGGLVTLGRIYHGAVPGECEFGHIRLERNRPDGSPGATVQDRCCGWAVDAKIRDAIQRGEPTILRELIAAISTPSAAPLPLREGQGEGRASSNLVPSVSPATSGDSPPTPGVSPGTPGTPGTPGGEARFLASALHQGDAVAARILRETADDLAFGLSHVVHLFHPQAIVLGGGLALIGEPWRAAVAAALPTYLMSAFQPGPRVLLSALGEDVVPVGALLLAAREGESWRFMNGDW